MAETESLLSPVDATLIRRVRRAASDYRAAHPLTRVPWEASSYPLAAHIHGHPQVKSLVWFPGPGCSWSESGGCLMCNFGESEADPVDPVDPVELLATHLAELDPASEHVHIGPGGSFYDDRETPPAVRRGVLAAVGALSRLRTLGLETRPNLLTVEGLEDTLAQLPPHVDRLILGFGLECWDDFLRELAVNKGYTRTSVLRAAEVITKVNATQSSVQVEFECYVLLKPTLLHEREAIDEALRTIDWSFRIGAATCALFINTIKDATVQGHLAARSDLEPPIRYQTPYLRSALEVLRRLPPSAQSRTAVLGLQSGIQATDGPRACERCFPFLLGAIYAHTFHRDPEVIERAASAWCPCKSDWQRELDVVDPSLLHERARRLITAMAEDGFG